MVLSVLVMPLYATPAMPVSQLLELQQKTESSEAPLEKLTSGVIVAESEAILQLTENQLLPINQQLLQLPSYAHHSAQQPIVANPAFVLKDNGLHTIFTAGP